MEHLGRDSASQNPMDHPLGGLDQHARRPINGGQWARAAGDSHPLWAGGPLTYSDAIGAVYGYIRTDRQLVEGEASSDPETQVNHQIRRICGTLFL